jgi:hypothetical protein
MPSLTVKEKEKKRKTDFLRWKFFFVQKKRKKKLKICNSPFKRPYKRTHHQKRICNQ